jgi:hypothetical protein
VSANVTQLRFAQLLKSALGLKTSDPGRVVSPLVSPMFPLVDAYQPEMRLRRGERLCSGAFSMQNTTTVFQLLNLTMPVQGGRIFVWKRVTLSINVPTTTMQPGVCYWGIRQPATNAPVPTFQLNLKDSRYAANASSAATGALVSTSNILSFGTFNATAVYAEQLWPTTAVYNLQRQVDLVDVVIAPGNSTYVAVGFDTVPTAAYNWSVSVEGYEYVPDPAELLPPPP